MGSRTRTGSADSLRAVRGALAARDQATTMLDRRRAELSQAVRAALESGWSARALGDELGLSHVALLKHAKQDPA